MSTTCPHCGATDLKDTSKDICIQCGQFISQDPQPAIPLVSSIPDLASPAEPEQESEPAESVAATEGEVDDNEVDFPTALVERGKRTRTRGKKKRRSQEISPSLAQARGKKGRQQERAAAKTKKKRAAPAWLVPALVFLAAAIVIVLALIAAQSKK